MTEPVVEVVTKGVLAARCIELGEEISRNMAERQPIFVGILNGAVPFLADLIRHVPGPVEVDFLSLTRFGDSGRVQISFDTETPLVGRHVVLVEDIVDTGLTLSALRSFMETRDVASVSTVTLIDKVTRRLVDVPLEYRGFEVGDEFLVGYGLDWEGLYRNLASIWAVMDLGDFAEDPTVLERRVFASAGDNLGP